MKSRQQLASAIQSLIVVLLCGCALGQGIETRSGKGFTFIPGDFAEYTNTMYEGDEKKALPSTIMVAMGEQDGKELVQILSARDDALVSKILVFYDLTKEKRKQGMLLGRGKEVLVINGRKYDCTWEKRRMAGTTGTFWTCPDLPFEKLAKVQMESPAGQKVVTELAFHGPDPSDPKKNDAFMKRLLELSKEK